MKSTFKEYLITEKVHANEYRSIANDDNFYVGLEFEYFDSNIEARNGGNSEYDEYNIHEHPDYVHYDDEMYEVFREHISEVDDIGGDFDPSKYHEQWELELKVETDKLKDMSFNNYSDIVKKFNKDNGTDYKPATYEKSKEIATSLSNLERAYNDANGDDVEYEVRIKQAEKYDNDREKLLIPYGLQNIRMSSSTEQVIKYALMDYNTLIKNITNSANYKLNLPSEVYIFKDWAIKTKVLEKENITMPNIDRDILTTIESFFKQRETIETIKNDMVDKIKESLLYSVDYFDLLDEYPNAFDESEYEYANDELMSELGIGEGNYGESDFSSIIENNFNFENFPFKNYTIDGNSVSTWDIVPDGSLDLNDGGIEITSPKLKLSDSLIAMKKMFNYIDENGATDDENGFHINLSYKGYDQTNLDVFKMMMFMEEKWIDDNFEGRLEGNWAASVTDIIRRKATSRLDLYKGFGVNYNQMKYKVEKALLPGNDKFNGINRVNVGGLDGRVEFRYVGGADYHTKYNLIVQHILRFCYLLKLGMDPNFKRKEYDTKILRLLQKYGDDAPAYRSLESTPNTLKTYMVDKKTGDVYYTINNDIIAQYSHDKKGDEVFKGKYKRQRIDNLIRSNPERYER